MITYVDASVLLRVVLGEPARLADWPLLVPVSSELIRVECLRILDRGRFVAGESEAASAQHRADVLEALDSFTLAPVSRAILERASDPFPTSLGTLDAIHLATAMEIRRDFPDIALATHDHELALAARAVGFAVRGVE